VAHTEMIVKKSHEEAKAEEPAATDLSIPQTFHSDFDASFFLREKKKTKKNMPQLFKIRRPSNINPHKLLFNLYPFYIYLRICQISTSWDTF